MRLLDTQKLELKNFSSEKEAPPYAILSHTWEAEEELLFDDLPDLSSPKTQRKKGYAKVLSFCHRARQDGHRWVWVDSCCIDKSSSAELSEAINSMFRWYASAQICYAYLADATTTTTTESDDNSRKKLDASCAWFHRGWTLQELIAPPDVVFYDGDWRFIGSRRDLAGELAAITRIETALLSEARLNAPSGIQMILDSFSIATRMAWASRRATTRIEDTAYCLMGLFGVNMPLLYGEGENAFQRLQEEIIKKSDDTSILAFQSGIDPWTLVPVKYQQQQQPSLLLARQPRNFKHILPSVREAASAVAEPCMSLGKSEISLNILLCPAGTLGNSDEIFYAIFDCMFERDYLARPAILLRKIQKKPQQRFMRIKTDTLYCVGPYHKRPKPVGQSTLDVSGFLPARHAILDKAKRERITITLFNEVLTPLPAIKLNYQLFKGLQGYRVDKSIPELVGDTSIPCTDVLAWGNRHGIISLIGPSGNRLLVVWGKQPGEHEAGSSNTFRDPLPIPWCKIWSPEQLAQRISDPSLFASLSSSPSSSSSSIGTNNDEIVDIIMSHSTEITKSVTPVNNLQFRDTVTVATPKCLPHTVTACISRLVFLGRVIFELEITVGTVESLVGTQLTVVSSHIYSKRKREHPKTTELNPGSW